MRSMVEGCWLGDTEAVAREGSVSPGLHPSTTGFAGGPPPLAGEDHPQPICSMISSETS